MKNIFDLELNELEDVVKSLGEPKFRAKQIFDWLYKGHRKGQLEGKVCCFDDMHNLPKALIRKLQDRYQTFLPTLIELQESKLDGTKKFLMEMVDGNAVESVFMPYKYGNSLCISSQAGCRMGCRFCASTLCGLERNLTAGEMLGQVMCAEVATEEKINHIVVMGTGEPFDNYEQISKFLRLANAPEGFDLSMRNITVSTCGIVPEIYHFAKDFRQVNLAISLHSADDKKRSEMMPINNRYGIDELLLACRDYVKQTGRRVTFEYTLVSDVNDSREDALLLAKKIKDINCHVNLISLNPVGEIKYGETNALRVKEFQNWLEELGVNVTVRRKLGTDIDGACGQLRLKNLV